MADKRFVAKNGLDNNNQTITNVAPPVNSTDVSTKAFSSDASNLTTGTIPADRVPSSLILDKTLTGYAVGSDAVLAATDTFVQAFGKLQAQINSRLTGNQSITVSGDASGSGTTAITLTLANSGVTAGSYGSSTAVPVLTVDGKGRVTGVTTASISGSLAFTGDVTGTGTTGSSTTLTLANTGVAAGTYTKVTVDAKGRVTNATTLASGDLPTYTGTLTSGQVTTALTFTPENAANKGQASGYASLDSGGKVPAGQLPSYVDDVLEYANLAAFPGTGETGKIYVTLDTNKVYRWSGSAYVEISPSPGSTDAVTEGSTNLYFTTARARSSISVAGSLSYNSSTGVISYTQPTNVSTFTNDSGYITSSALSPYLTTSTAASTYLPLAGGTLTGASTVSVSTWAKWTLETTGVTAKARQGSDTNGLNFTTNALWSGSAWVEDDNTKKKFAYIQHLGNGRHEFRTAATGAGIAWTTSLTVDDSAVTANVALNGTTATFSGNVKSGNITLRDDSVEQHVADTDTAGIAVNYAGYNAAFTRFRNFTVFDGKGAEKFKVTGSSGAVTVAGNQVLHAGNYNSYAPTLTGTGASGTWGINITGNAATVTSITSSQVTTALGYTPVNPANHLVLGTIGNAYTSLANSANGSLQMRGSTSNFILNVQDGSGRVSYMWNASGGTTSGTYLVSSEQAIRQTMTPGTVAGKWEWWGAPAGTAGNAITWTQYANMDPGNVFWWSPRGTYTDFSIDNSGVVSVGVSLTAPSINSVINSTAAGGSIMIKHSVSEVDAWIFQENAANWGLYWKNNPSGNHTFGGYTTVGAELVGMSASNASGNGVATTGFVGATTAIAQWMISNYTGYIWSASTIYAVTSMVVGGNTVLHAGNYGSYALPLSGGTVTGQITGGRAAGAQVIEFANADNYVSMRVVRNNSATDNRDGMYLGYGNSNSGITRIFGGGATTGGIEVTGNGVNNVTIAGHVALNANNYSSYALPLSGGNITGVLQFGGALYHSAANQNTLNSGYGSDADNADMWINYRGYNDGFTRFRDFRIGDGKGALVALFTGSNKSAAFQGAVSAVGNLSASGTLSIASSGQIDGPLAGNGRWLISRATLDLSGLSSTTYYPVTIPINTHRTVRLRIENALNSNVPSWSTHPSGFSCYIEWIVNGAGWGTIAVNRRVVDWRESFSTVTIVGGLDQMTTISTEVIWLRGGGIYYFSADDNVSPTIRTSSYTANGQTVAPLGSTLNNPHNTASGRMSYGTFQANSSIDIAGNVALHAGNYNSYALPLSGGSLSGNLQFGTNLLQFDQSGTRSWSIRATGGNLDVASGDGLSNFRFNGGAILTANNYSSYAPRVVFGDSGAHNLNVSGQHADFRYSTGQWVNGPTPGNYSHVLSFNGATDNRTVQVYFGDLPGYLWWRPNQAGTWHPWERILTSNNYNTWAPSLTGTGASGTWGINITGNAGYASSAGSAGYASSAGSASSASYASTAGSASTAKQIISDYQEWDFAWGSHGTTPMSISIWDNYTQSGAPSGYGTLVDIYGLSGHQHDQLYFYQGNIISRYGWYGNNNWSGWYTLLTSANYNNYSPTLTGTGASGTWGINISGNAATATSSTDSTKLPLSGGTLSGDLTMANAGTSQKIVFGESTKAIYVSGYWMIFAGHVNEGWRFRDNNGVDRVQINGSSGSATFTGDVTAYSDIRVKRDIELITDAVAKVRRLRGVTFTRTDHEDMTTRHAGVIAQEVEEVLPEVVGENEHGHKHVAYGNMVGLLIEAIKEQQAEIAALRDEVRALKEG